jgi:hypothetical protein
LEEDFRRDDLLSGVVVRDLNDSARFASLGMRLFIDDDNADSGSSTIAAAMGPKEPILVAALDDLGCCCCCCCEGGSSATFFFLGDGGDSTGTTSFLLDFGFSSTSCFLGDGLSFILPSSTSLEEMSFNLRGVVWGDNRSFFLPSFTSLGENLILRGISCAGDGRNFCLPSSTSLGDSFILRRGVVNISFLGESLRGVVNVDDTRSFCLPPLPLPSSRIRPNGVMGAEESRRTPLADDRRGRGDFASESAETGVPPVPLVFGTNLIFLNEFGLALLLLSFSAVVLVGVVMFVLVSRFFMAFAARMRCDRRGDFGLGLLLPAAIATAAAMAVFFFLLLLLRRFAAFVLATTSSSSLPSSVLV